MGMPSCHLLVSWDWETLVWSYIATASWKIQIPNDKLLPGRQFFTQYWTLHKNANPAGVAVSNGGKGVLGF